MNLQAFCLRCNREFEGPDEGCPECDRDNPDVTSARNRCVGEPGKLRALEEDDEEGGAA